MKLTKILFPVLFIFTLSLTLVAPVDVVAQEVVTIDRSLGTSVEFDETEGMTIRYDSLLNDWKVKMYLYEDSTCHGLEIDPTFPDSVYIDRLQRIPAVMELPYNHIVRQYIDRYTKRLRKSVGVMLGAGNFYFPIFETELERYGLPLELKYLPVIESALKPKAVSPAGAGGLWQFMVGTGKQYGLKVNSVIDERCDPIKSSAAAARYLRDLYRIYNDWALVLAAYNCGPGNVNRAIHRAGARDYWQIYPYLPKETRGYVPAFIAATYAMTYYCEHGICPMRTRFPIATDTIVVNRDISMRQISEVVGISLDILKSLNPQYRTDRIPGKSQPCTLRMPDDMLHAFLDYGDDVYKYRADELLARRSEVSVRGERNNRMTASRAQQPAEPVQNTMTGSEMPSIADTEPVVATEESQPYSQPNQQTALAGNVTEVEAEKESVTPENQIETTAVADDDDEGDLRPVQTTTQRIAPVAQPRPQTQLSSASETSVNSGKSKTSHRAYNNRQQTQSSQNTTVARQRQQPAAPVQQPAQTKRAQRQQAATTQQAQTQTTKQQSTTTRNRTQRQPAAAQSQTQSTKKQTQTQSQTTARTKSQSQTQSTKKQTQTQSQTTARTKSQSQTQSTKKQAQTQSQTTARAKSQSQTQSTKKQTSAQSSQTTSRTKSQSQTQSTKKQTSAQSQTTARAKSQSQTQSTKKQAASTSTTQRQHTPRSGKAGTNKK